VSPLSQKILSAITLILAAGLGAPAGVSAQDDDPPPTVAYRQSLMQGFRMHTGALRAIFGDDVAYTSHIALHANTIRDLTMMLSDVFPEGSGGEDSGAMDAIWTNAGDFQKRLAGFQGAGAHLAGAAASGDMAATQEAFQTFSRGCRGCHSDYRKPNN
jgi:cytochrome c556